MQRGRWARFAIALPVLAGAALSAAVPAKAVDTWSLTLGYLGGPGDVTTIGVPPLLGCESGGVCWVGGPPYSANPMTITIADATRRSIGGYYVLDGQDPTGAPASISGEFCSSVTGLPTGIPFYDSQGHLIGTSGILDMVVQVRELDSLADCGAASGGPATEGSVTFSVGW
ncbi:MAG: hypothetical protein ACYDAY_00965 [Candidatus Dormibacteria bacterium]